MTELKLNEYQQKLYDENVVHSWTTKIGRKTTVVTIQLKNGFEITGVSGCVDPRDYDFNIGYHYALVDALSKADGFIGYARQEGLYKQQQQQQMTSNWHDIGFIKDSTFSKTPYDISCNLMESNIKVTDTCIPVAVKLDETIRKNEATQVVARGTTTVKNKDLTLPLRQVNRKGDFASSIIGKLQAGGK